MIKKLIWILVIAVIIYFAYYYFTTGNLTEEERQLKQMEKEFNAALSQYQQYVRMAGTTGMDITFEVGDIESLVEKLKEELVEFKKQQPDESLLPKADVLIERMDRFLSQIR